MKQRKQRSQRASKHVVITGSLVAASSRPSCLEIANLANHGATPTDQTKMNPIETLTGDVNLRTASAKAYVFHTPRKGGVGVEERILPVAAKSGQTNSVITPLQSFAQRTPSVQGYSVEVGGSMTAQSFIVAEGEILKFFVNRRPGAGKLPLTACQFIRVRETAALRCIEAKLLTDPKVTQPFAMIRGRFDLLTLEEAVALGVTVNPGFMRQFHPANAGACMTVALMQPEAAKAEVQVLPSGESIVVTQTKRRRQLGGF